MAGVLFEGWKEPSVLTLQTVTESSHHLLLLVAVVEPSITEKGLTCGAANNFFQGHLQGLKASLQIHIRTHRPY